MRFVNLVKLAVSEFLYGPGTRRSTFRSVLEQWRSMPKLSKVSGDRGSLMNSNFWFERSVLPAKRA